MLPVLLGSGWRGGGDGVYATAPAGVATEAWRTPIATGNASPVRAGGCVLVTAEPTTLACLDPRTGDVRWQATHPAVDAMPAERQAVLRPQLAEVEDLQASLVQARRAHQVLLRDARRVGSGVTRAQIDAAAGVVDGIAQQLAATAPFRTPPTDEVGYATPTPWAEGDTVWAAFGHGVVAARRLDGTVRWRRWLGRAPADKLGYDGGETASLGKVDDVIVVAQGTLQGLDATTGESRWTGPASPHFGTPVVARAAGKAWLVSPGGEIVDPATGAVAAGRISTVAYNGPAADGDLLVTVGLDEDAGPFRANRAEAWRLAADGTVTPLWAQALETMDRFYGTPLVHDGLVHVVSRHRDHHVFDADTGALLQRRVLGDLRGEVFASPVHAAGQVWVTTSRGDLVGLADAPPFDVQTGLEAAPGMGTPTFDDDRLYHRGWREVVAFTP